MTMMMVNIIFTMKIFTTKILIATTVEKNKVNKKFVEIFNTFEFATFLR